jgi:hypothetical protein
MFEKYKHHLTNEDMDLIQNSHLREAHNDPLLGILRKREQQIKPEGKIVPTLKNECFRSIALNFRRFILHEDHNPFHNVLRKLLE